MLKLFFDSYLHIDRETSLDSSFLNNPVAEAEVLSKHHKKYGIFRMTYNILKNIQK